MKTKHEKEDKMLSIWYHHVFTGFPDNGSSPLMGATPLAGAGIWREENRTRGGGFRLTEVCEPRSRKLKVNSCVFSITVTTPSFSVSFHASPLRL